jgi:glucose/mannose-6-phosphate isomerase
MLDDLKMIHDRDSTDALGVAEKQYSQLSYTFDAQVPKFEGILNVVMSGMGGSAFPGVFLQSWPGTLVPFEIVRNYDIPAYVGGQTLFISSSHSGNTEETLEALAKAEERGAKIVVIASGGKLGAVAEEKGYPLFRIPTGIQPRMCAFYFWAALVQLLEPLGLVPAGSTKELAGTGEWLQGQTADWRPDVATAKNPAKQLAQELMGTSVVVYSGPKLFPAANKWKICTNENAKNVAWVNQLPEFNHNEFIGWSSHPVDKPYSIIDIRSDLEHERVQKRFPITERLLSGQRPVPHVVEPQGDSQVKQIAWTANYAEFVSLYLALLNGLDPAPVDLVEKLKAELVK